MMHSFFHRLHTYVRDTYFRDPHITAPAKETVKKYVRMSRTQLPDTSLVPSHVREIMHARRSSLEKSGSPLSLAQLSSILDASMRIRDAHRPYPSGGSLYPIEAYCIVSEATDFAAGVYHYRPDSHQLERLWDTPNTASLKNLLYDTHNTPVTTLIMLTSVWERSAAKYQHFAYELALIEAGHIAQNILLSATALSCETRPFGGFDAEKIASILDIDTTREDCIYSIALST